MRRKPENVVAKLRQLDVRDQHARQVPEAIRSIALTELNWCFAAQLDLPD